MSIAPLFTCHVDGLLCDVANCIAPPSKYLGPTAFERLKSAFEQTARCLPCKKCREARAAADRLPGTRLGKHERNILLYAPSHTAKVGAILDPDLATHSDRETYLRAIRKLARLGLLEAGQKHVRVDTGGKRKDGSLISRSYRHRTLKQTWLGALVAEHYKLELESSCAIRWALHIDAIRVRAALPPKDLLNAYAVSLNGWLEALPANAPQNTVAAKNAHEARHSLQPLQVALQKAIEQQNANADQQNAYQNSVDQQNIDLQSGGHSAPGQVPATRSE